MPSKEPQSLTLKEFAGLSEAPATGRGGPSKKLNWDAIFEAINKRPMSATTVFDLICGDKATYLLDATAVDPNPGTIWVKLNKWAKEKIIRKAIDKKGNIFYGPTPSG